MERERGFGMVEALIIAGIVSVAIMSIASLNFRISSQLAQSASLVQMSIFRSNLVTLINNKSSWDNTIQINPSMSCLFNHTPCTQDGTPNGQPLQNQPFAIYDGSASATPFYDATILANGLTNTTTPCTGFSARGNDSCPFRFNLTWGAQCRPPNCVDPQVVVSAPLQYSPATQAMIVNPANYSVPPIFRSAQ